MNLPPELLEHVLSFLSTRELLFAPSVCTYWKGLIAGSTKLQTALFRVESQTEHDVIRHTYRDYPQDPDLEDPDAIPKEKQTLRIVKARASDHEGKVYSGYGNSSRGHFYEDRYVVGVVNDLFFHSIPADSHGKSMLSFGERDFYGSREQDTELLFCSQDGHSVTMQRALQSTSTNWRNMFVTQPPQKHIRFGWVFRVPAEAPRTRQRLPPHIREVEECHAIEAAGGVTIGHVADSILRYQAVNGGSVDWDSCWLLARNFICVTHNDIERLLAQDDSSDDGAGFVDEDHDDDSVSSVRDENVRFQLQPQIIDDDDSETTRSDDDRPLDEVLTDDDSESE